MNIKKENLIQKTILHLKKNQMNGIYIKNRTELENYLNEVIPEHATVGTGDSITLEELDVFHYFRKRNLNFLDKHQENLGKEEKRKIYLSNFDADFFVSGSNAIVSDGRIFNIDGNGSRVAPMLYGPKKVLIIVGVNKIVNTLEEGIKRTRQIAAPLDAKRLLKHTPCTKLDRCIDCKHKERICNDFVLITHQFDKERITVLIVDGIFGY